MISQGRLKKILWTVDPFIEDKGLQRSAAWAIRSLVKQTLAEVIPIHVFNPHTMNLPADITLELVEEARLGGQEALDEILSRVKIPAIHPLEMLFTSHFTHRALVQELIHYAKHSDVDLIVASTRARRGLSRWISGSFVETLITYSDIPTFLVNPAWQRTTDFHHILFPTDFSENSRDGYIQTLEFARAIKSRVTLFHKVNYGLSLPVPAEYPTYQQIIRNEIDAQRAEAKLWAQEGSSFGVEIETFIDYSLDHSVADSILTRANLDSSIIAMVSRSGPISSVLLGSTTRRVLRHSIQPVWVIHPKGRKGQRGLYSVAQEHALKQLPADTEQDVPKKRYA